MVTRPVFLTTNTQRPASRVTLARSHSALVIVLCQMPSSFVGTALVRLVAAPPVATGHAIASANAATIAPRAHLRPNTRLLSSHLTTSRLHPASTRDATPALREAQPK